MCDVTSVLKILFFPASEVSVDVENRLLVFNQKPAISVPESTSLFNDDGTAVTLADLADSRIILEGEVIGGTPTATNITLLETISFLRLVVEVGDFDGEGAQNDARLRAFEGDTEEEFECAHDGVSSTSLSLPM